MAKVNYWGEQKKLSYQVRGFIGRDHKEESEGGGRWRDRRSPLNGMDQEHVPERNASPGQSARAEVTQMRFKQQVLG